MPNQRGLVVDDLGVAWEGPAPERKQQQDDQDEKDEPTHAHQRVGDNPQNGLIQRQGGDTVTGYVVC